MRMRGIDIFCQFIMLILGLIVYLCPLLVDGWIFPFNLGEILFSFFRKRNTTTEMCKFSLNEDIPQTPLILNTKKLPKMVYPDDNNQIILKAHEQLKMTCIDRNFNRPFKGKLLHEVIITCVRDNIVSIGDEQMPISDLECDEFPEPVIKKRQDQTCYHDNSLMDVGFECYGTFLKLFTVCFDEKSENAIYSWYDSSMLHKGRQINVRRPHFAEKEFYTFAVDAAYVFQNQRDWLAYILGSDDLASRFVVNDYQHYLSRGHLTPKADFVYGVEQAATFLFINAAPQWQTFNAGNWWKLENGVRDLLIDRELSSAFACFIYHLEANWLQCTVSIDSITIVRHFTEIDIHTRYRVITGTYGVATLPDANNHEKELYLYVDENNNPLLKVPRFYWKIVYDMNKDTGVVIIGVNNPYLREIPPDYIICRNICERIRWLPNFKNEIRKGYIYCCDMDEFLKVTGFDTTFMH